MFRTLAVGVADDFRTELHSLTDVRESSFEDVLGIRFCNSEARGDCTGDDPFASLDFLKKETFFLLLLDSFKAFLLIPGTSKTNKKMKIAFAHRNKYSRENLTFSH